MPCSKNMCGKAEAMAGDDSECEALGTRRGRCCVAEAGEGYVRARLGKDRADLLVENANPPRGADFASRDE